MYNRVILIGYLTRDIELRYTPAGAAVAKTGIATNRTYNDAVTKEKKQEVMFIDITLFGRSAETANQWLKKGSKVLVEGRLALDQWTGNDGQKRSKHSVIAEKLQFMDSKKDNNNNNVTNNNNNYQQRQEKLNTNKEKVNTTTPKSVEEQKGIPSIDIDEEDIPF
jgi:single-strand DNA-binding protein